MLQGNTKDEAHGAGKWASVESELLFYAKDSMEWMPIHTHPLTRSVELMPTLHSSASSLTDLNVAQEEDVMKSKIWQHVINYATQAAEIQWWNPDDDHDSSLLDENLPEELRKRIGTACGLLEHLGRLLRLRALLSSATFGEPWDSMEFTHWFVKTFYVPMSNSGWL